jgi:hypothetical protein
MVKCKWFSFLLTCFIVFSCGKNLPELKGIDKPLWVADKNACSGKRSTMMSFIKREKEKLLSLNEMQVVDLLGRPDQNELSKRNQKFYYYFLQPAPDCMPKADSSSSKLVIRFNAMGLAKEVSIE